MKTLVIGLGNPILGDDGVGWKVADEVRKQLISPSAPLPEVEERQIDVDFASLGGISLMERLIGYDRAILTDAFAVDEPIGSLSVLQLDQLPNYSAFHIAAAHDTSLQNAIELGRSLGAYLPEDVTIVGIAIQPIYDFCEELSPAVARAVPLAAKIILDMLKETVLTKQT